MKPSSSFPPVLLSPARPIPVHGVNGLFGVLCVGLFTDGTYGGGWNLTGITKNGGADKPLIGLIPSIIQGNASAGIAQLEAQLIGIATLLVWAFGFSYIFFKVQHKIMGIRVSAEDEMAGLDITETGVLAYPEFAIHPGGG